MSRFPLNLVDCQWSKWTASSCSATCGGGNMRKTRNKIIEEKDGGICTGNAVEDEECNERECPGRGFGFRN